jgi:outer membrane protein
MKMKLSLAFAAAAAIATPAAAQSSDGRFEVKVLATGLLVDGKITEVKKDPLGLTAGAQTDVSDNVVPTLAVEYYATPNFSIETICCLTEHHAVGTGSLAGAQLIDHVLILPATVTLKYHLNAGPVRPYVGVGPALFLVLNSEPGATARSLGVDKVEMSSNVGVAFQGGIDIPVNKSGMGISLDAKKYLMDTTARFYAGGTEVLATRHKLDPWLLSGGAYLRF